MLKSVLRERVEDSRHWIAIGLSFRDRQKREIDKLGGVGIGIFRNEIRRRFFGNV